MNGESRVPDEFHNPRHLSRNYYKIERTFDVDARPSQTPMRVIDHGNVLVFRMDVLGEGTMEMIVQGDAKTGRLDYKGMRLCLTRK